MSAPVKLPETWNTHASLPQLPEPSLPGRLKVKNPGEVVEAFKFVVLFWALSIPPVELKL